MPDQKEIEKVKEKENEKENSPSLPPVSKRLDDDTDQMNVPKLLGENIFLYSVKIRLLSSKSKCPSN